VLIDPLAAISIKLKLRSMMILTCKAWETPLLYLKFQQSICIMVAFYK
jgi:hypothetical protein